MYLEQWDTLITPLNKFTTRDKILVFDKLYAQSRKYLREYVENRREPIDGDRRIYEATLYEMLGDEIWNIIRAIGT
jgi:hypothetical protein